MTTMTMPSANGAMPVTIEKILDEELGDKCGLYARVTIPAGKAHTITSITVTVRAISFSPAKRSTTTTAPSARSAPATRPGRPTAPATPSTTPPAREISSSWL